MGGVVGTLATTTKAMSFRRAVVGGVPTTPPFSCML